MTNWLDFLRLFSEKNKHLTRTELLQKAKFSFVKLKDYYEQYGGGDCSLCGSSGTNKSTCPRNPDAKNPNPAKHPNASVAAPVVVRASSVKAPAVPVVVRASSVKAPAVVPLLDPLSQLIDKLDTLEDLSTLSEDEINIIIDYSSTNLSQEEKQALKTLIPKTKFIEGWVNCFTGKVQKEEKDSFFLQLVSRIQCYLKYADNTYLIDLPRAVVKANSVHPSAAVRANSVKAPAAVVRVNSVKPVVAQKGKTAPVDDERGCVEQSDKKYRERPSPPFPANQCCGEKMKGNDGRMYESRADKNGTCKWYVLK
jgi:hypothetical protein